MTDDLRKVSIRSHFLRSTRLDSGIDSKELLETFILHESGESILSRTIEGMVGGKERSFTWTGAYGSGKSTIGLYLSMLLEAESERRNFLQPKGSRRAFKDITKHIPKNSGPWLTINIVGQKAPIEPRLTHSICDALPALMAENLSFGDLLKSALSYVEGRYGGL